LVSAKTKKLTLRFQGFYFSINEIFIWFFFMIRSWNRFCFISAAFLKFISKNEDLRFLC